MCVCVFVRVCVNPSSSRLSSPLLSSLCSSPPRLSSPSRPNFFLLLLLFFFFSPLQQRSLSKSCLLPPLLFILSLDTSFLQGKNSIVHFVSLSASIYAPPLPSFLFILFLSFLFFIFSLPLDRRFWDPSIEISHLHCLPLSSLSPLEFCPFYSEEAEEESYREGKKAQQETL